MHGLTLVGIGIVCTITLCVYLISYFSSDDVPQDVKFVVLVSWILGFAGIIILPYDISLALTDVQLEDGSTYYLSTLWSTLYWSTFLLAWVILPIQNNYHTSGEFTFRSKVRDAIMKTVRYYALVFLGLVVYIMYTAVSEDTSISAVYSLTMALGNTYGVLLFVVLAGSGIVSIPRHLWNLSNIDRTLRRKYIAAVSKELSVLDARHELNEVKAVVLQLWGLGDISGGGGEESHMQHVRQLIGAEVGATTTITPVSEGACLVDLHVRVKKCLLRQKTCEQSWCKLQDDVMVLEQAVQERDGLRSMETAGTAGQRGSFWTTVCNWCISHKSYALRAISLELTVCSCILLWCEIFIPSSISSPIGYIIGVYTGSVEDAVAVQVSASLVILYMTACAYYTLFTLGLGWEYSLVGPCRSPLSALIFNAEYATRIQFSICYNFLLLTHTDSGTNSGTGSIRAITGFQNIMERMETTPLLGADVNIYVPVTMVLVAVLTYLRLYEKVLNMVPSWELEDYAGSDGANEEEKVRMGKLLLANERRSKLVKANHPTININSPARHTTATLQISGMKMANSYNHSGSSCADVDEADDDTQCDIAPVHNPLRGYDDDDCELDGVSVERQGQDVEVEREDFGGGRYSGI